MKKISVFTLLILIIVFIQPLQIQTASAQTTDKINFYIEAGPGIPAAPNNFTQNWNVGYGLGAGVGYDISPSVKLQLLGQYHRFGFDKHSARNNVTVPQAITSIDGADAQLYTVMLNVIYNYKLPDVPVSTYFSVGAGYIRAVRDDFTISTSDKTFGINQTGGSSLGVNGAVGLQRTLNSNLSLYLEAKFVTGLFVDHWTQYVPISLGITF